MSQIHERYLVNNVVKPNEVRAELGKPALEGLDTEKQEREERMANMKADSQQASRDARDRERDANNSDGPATATGRNPKGSGAKELK